MEDPVDLALHDQRENKYVAPEPTYWGRELVSNSERKGLMLPMAIVFK